MPNEGQREQPGEQPAAITSLADPQVPSKVGEGVRARFAESINTTGRALTVIAGLGVFFFAAGYFVEWQRFKRGGLPAQEILPLLPKEQIAAAGVKELFISIVFGGLVLLLVGYVLVRVGRAIGSRWMDGGEEIVATAVVGGLALVLVPSDTAGFIAAALLTALLYYSLRLVKDFLKEGNDEAKFPLWRLVIAVAIVAVALSAARQWEFPEARPRATVVLIDGNVRLSGTYVASDSDKILIKKNPFKGKPRKREPMLISVPRSEVKKIELWDNPKKLDRDESLLDEVLGEIWPGARFVCIPPECRAGEDTRIGPSSLF